MTTTTAPSSSAEAMLDRFLAAGRNHAPRILVDAILDGTVPESDMPLLIAEAWTVAEYPTRCEEPFIWKSLFHRVGYCNAAGESIGRPEGPVTLWRGASRQEGITGNYGMSWTTDRDKAQWFAERFEKGDTCVYRAEVEPAALLADYRDAERNESEIVVNPAMLADLPTTDEEVSA